MPAPLTRETIKNDLLDRSKVLAERNRNRAQSAYQPDGAKLAEAAQHLRAARMTLLLWMRDTYATTNNVVDVVDDARTMLEYTVQIENMRYKLDVRASILGK